MVELNFDRSRPAALINLNEVAELRGWSHENGTLRLGAGLTYAEAMAEPLAEPLPALAEASRTVGSPQIRNRGTIGGNLGTASPAGDALPPLLVERAESSLRACAARRRCRSATSSSASKRNALADDELIVAVLVAPERRAADLHEGRPAQRDGDRRLLARLVVDRERGELAPRSAPRRPSPALVTARSETRTPSPTRCAAAACPIDDVRGTAAYRRHALGVLAGGRSRGARMRIALTVNGEPREADVGAARACFSRSASGSACPARRTPASRASAARARCSSTACSSAPASCSRRRPTGTRSSPWRAWPATAAAPRPGGVRRGGRRPVRLLHAGPRRRDRRPARADARTRPTTRSARRCPATSAAAPATRRSSTRCGPRRGELADAHEAARAWQVGGRVRRPTRCRR